MDDMEDDTPDPLERDDTGRSVVPEAMPTPEPEPEPEPGPEPEPKPAPRRGKSVASAQAPSSLDGTVYLSSLTVQGYSMRSLSVLLLQDRLAEMGHADARSDMPGWLSHGTVAALRDFQAARGLPVTGEPDRDTVEAIMAGTAVEVLPIS